jgi:acetoin utilization protein AcuC
MTCTVHVAWDEGLTDYHFGPDHPLAPVRVELTMQLAREFGLWARRDGGRPGPRHPG